MRNRRAILPFPRLFGAASAACHTKNADQHSSDRPKQFHTEFGVRLGIHTLRPLARSYFAAFQAFVTNVNVSPIRSLDRRAAVWEIGALAIAFGVGCRANAVVINEMVSVDAMKLAGVVECADKLGVKWVRAGLARRGRANLREKFESDGTTKRERVDVPDSQEFLERVARRSAQLPTWPRCRS
jgi:hypothetical protein